MLSLAQGENNHYNVNLRVPLRPFCPRRPQIYTSYQNQFQKDHGAKRGAVVLSSPLKGKVRPYQSEHCELRLSSSQQRDIGYVSSFSQAQNDLA